MAGSIGAVGCVTMVASSSKSHTRVPDTGSTSEGVASSRGASTFIVQPSAVR